MVFAPGQGKVATVQQEWYLGLPEALRRLVGRLWANFKMELYLTKKIFVGGFKEISPKTGKNVGTKTLCFTVFFQFESQILMFSGWRLRDKKIHPPSIQYGYKFLNLCAVDSATASEIYSKLKQALVDSEFKYHELAESSEEAITLIVARKSDLKKFAPELFN
ncbi:hypothetical protein UFOVP434_4 [uncultured Caudovirales phage]|uniref:Uncharacterized protein n=1 Tax=uncultured Caudovirales phage TaxID=2100421 RepID=A0A6J5MB56_9CAUD|nr:hypothetical protein UFOVP434_4 [uncultured Caudovirales phage]